MMNWMPACSREGNSDSPWIASPQPPPQPPPPVSCVVCQTRGTFCSIHADKPYSSTSRSDSLSAYTYSGTGYLPAATPLSGAPAAQVPLADHLNRIDPPPLQVGQDVYYPNAVTRYPPSGGRELYYRKVFAGLAQSTVELFLQRFNSLGCTRGPETALSRLSRVLLHGTDSISSDTSPKHFQLQMPDNHQVQRLIEVWFTNHPLSFILSKTLFFQAYRNGTHDTDLLTLILVEAQLFESNRSLHHPDAIYESARENVLRRSVSSLSTVQALAILGWSDFCFDQPRQGYCYTARALKSATTYLEKTPNDNSANSIQNVEKELYQRIYWFTSSISLWLYLHSKEPLCLSEKVHLPPSDVSSSAVYSLESRSGNIASLVAQKTTISELWSLAYLTSVMAPMFENHLHQSSEKSPLQRCNIISAACKGLPATPDHSNPAHTFTDSALKLLAIHMAFPPHTWTVDETATPRPAVEWVLRLIQAFHTTIPILLRQTGLPYQVDADDWAARTEAWRALGEESCNRAMHRLQQLAPLQQLPPPPPSSSSSSLLSSPPPHDASVVHSPDAGFSPTRLGRLGDGLQSPGHAEQWYQQEQRQEAQKPVRTEVWAGDSHGLSVMYSGEPDVTVWSAAQAANGNVCSLWGQSKG